MTRYQDIYPSEPLVRSAELARPQAASMLTLEYFEAEPAAMPYEVFEQHHLLLNLKDEPHRVENWRDGEHRDFIFRKNEAVLTPAGVRSGWRWHAKSRCIIITLDPARLEAFARSELGVELTDRQLASMPQFLDEDIVNAGRLLLQALQAPELGSQVIYESLARIFLVKLLQKYGLRSEPRQGRAALTSRRFKRVLDYIARRHGGDILLEDMAREASLSPFHFSRLFKEAMGMSPHQFVMSYRVEQAKAQLADPERAMIDIALACGFGDQAHFSRVFKQFTGLTPRQHRRALEQGPAKT